MIPAGRLRHRITLQRKASGRDSLNQRNCQWLDVAKRVPALVEATKADETIQVGQVVAGAQWKITIRRRSGVDAEMRVLWGERVLNIVGEFPDERGRDQFLYCKS